MSLASPPSSLSFGERLGAATGAADLAGALQDERARLREKDLAQPQGRRSARALSEATDRVIFHMWQLSLPDDPEVRERVRPKLSIVATGGYGRRELCPHSDIDVTFIVGEEGDAELDQVVRRMFHTLLEVFQQGVGLRVGYGYRSPADAATLDHQTQTSLLDARPVAGSHGLVERFLQEMFRQTWPAEFVRIKLKERSLVRAREGGTIYRVEPELRDGPGALRDLQLAEWLAIVSFPASRGDVWNQLHRLGAVSREEIGMIQDAHSFLLKLRVWSHWSEGRKADRLVRARQEELAEVLQFEDDASASRVERLMERYYRHAENISRIAGFVADRCLSERLALTPEILCARNEMLPAFPWVKVSSPEFLMHLCHLHQSLGLAPGYELSRMVAQNIRGCNMEEGAAGAAARFVDLLRIDRPSSEAAALFEDQNEALTASRLPGVHDTLVLMSRLGILQCFIPELQTAFRQVPFDQVHVHTVGFHSLETVRHLENVRHTTEEALRIFTEIWASVRSPELLYLGALLHDIGKLADPSKSHTDAGAEMATTICSRLCLGEDETRTIAFLVQHHLLMSDTAQLRDLGLEETISGFVSVVNTPDLLNMLILLTFADMAATGVMTPMKARFLQDLYLRAEARLAGAGAGAGSDEDKARRFRSRLSRHLSGGSLTPEQVAQHTDRMPVSYLLSTSPDQIALHIRMAGALATGGHDAEIEFEQEPGLALTTLHICTPDRPEPGVLSRIAGVLYAHDMAVHAAQVYTRQSDPPVAMDTLWIDYQGRPAPPMKRIELDRDLRAVLASGQVEDLLRSRGKSLRPLTPAERIRVRQDVAENHTVIEVKAADHPGLLYWVTRAMASLGWNIASARVANQASTARDAFYVTDSRGEKLREPREAVVDALARALAE